MSVPDIRETRQLDGPYHRWILIHHGNNTWHVECKNGTVSPRFPTEEEAMGWLTEQWEAWQQAEASIYGGP